MRASLSLLSLAVWQCKAPTANYFHRASSVSAGLTRAIVMVSSLMHSVYEMSQLSAGVFFLDRRSWAHPASNSLGNKRLCFLSWAPFWYPKLGSVCDACLQTMGSFSDTGSVTEFATCSQLGDLIVLWSTGLSVKGQQMVKKKSKHLI